MSTSSGGCWKCRSSIYGCTSVSRPAPQAKRASTEGSMKKLRTAFIGVDYMGRFQAEKFADIAGAELRAVVDADAARAKEIAAALGCGHETDHRALLAHIDAACVAVPTEKHHAVVRDCLEAGVHVLVEKPLARTLEEADALLALARAKGLVPQVGHLQRFNPAFQAPAAPGRRPPFIDIQRP